MLRQQIYQRLFDYQCKQSLLEENCLQGKVLERNVSDIILSQARLLKQGLQSTTQKLIQLLFNQAL